MLTCYQTKKSDKSIPIHIITPKTFSTWLDKQKTTIKNWLSSNGFRGEPGNLSMLADTSGKVESIVFCIPDKNNFWSIGSLPLSLPEGDYHFNVSVKQYQQYAIVWGLGAYQFTQYKKASRKPARLVLAKDIDQHYIANMVESTYLVRDLINLPTENLGPTEFSEIAKKIAKECNAQFKQIVGDELLKQNYPTIHAVGRACDDAPRIVDIRWGNKKHPKVTLVGKGVCFDTGGLDIKNSSGMLLMKKDMGGAANILGLARMIMLAKIPVCLRVLLPMVENSISGNAYRPGDVIKSRKGITIEIGNTDAEGRLVLCDALAEAVSENPELIIDMATLTGAARIALGTELPALFSNDDKVAHHVIQYATEETDPLWRMPLFSAYRDSINSNIADINNAGADSYGGAITAALFLKEFVPDDIAWMHIDLMAWNLRSKPGRPQGGEAMGIRALFSYLSERYQ